MLRQMLHPTQKQIILELPDDYLNQDIEILAFRLRDAEPVPSHPPAASTGPIASTEDALALLDSINLHFDPNDFSRKEANVRR